VVALVTFPDRIPVVPVGVGLGVGVGVLLLPVPQPGRKTNGTSNSINRIRKAK